MPNRSFRENNPGRREILEEIVIEEGLTEVTTVKKECDEDGFVEESEF